MNSSTTGAELDPVVEPLAWSVRHASDQPSRRVVVVLACLTAFVFGTAILGNLVLGLAGALAVFLSTIEVFLPVHFRLDAKGASRRLGLSVTAIEWGDVKRLIVTDTDVRLSPLAAPSRLDAFRGVCLVFTGNRDEVLAKIRALWDGDAGLLDGRTDGRGGGGTDRADRSAGQEAETGDARDPLP